MRPVLAFALLVGLFGLLIGSFLNVVVHRVPAGLSRRQPAVGLSGLQHPHPAPGQRPGGRMAAAAGQVP